MYFENTNFKYEIQFFTSNERKKLNRKLQQITEK